MRHVMTAAVAVICVGAVSSTASAQGQRGGGQGPGAPACTTLACDVQTDWARNGQLLVGLVDAMPADRFDYKATPPQQTFAERVMHVVGTDIKILGTLGGKTPAPAIDLKASSKADVLAALKQSMDYGAAVLKEFNDQQFLERVASLPFLGPTASRARVAYFSIAHSQDIYGQLVVYLRLNGGIPPASNRP